MRRGKLTKRSVTFVILAGFFSLLSIFLDQQVIQNENLLRNVEIKSQSKIEKVNELNSNYWAASGIEDRANSLTSYHTFYSTLYYKIYLKLIKDDDFKKHFNKYAEEYMSGFMKYDLLFITYDLMDIKEEVERMSFYYYEYPDKELQDKVKSLFVYEYPVKETILDKMKPAWDGEESLQDIIFSPEEIHEIYLSLFQLNKQFAFSIKKIIEIRHFFETETEKEEERLNLLLEKRLKIKIYKNYLILSSILAQIMSLMALLFLFRGLIKERL